MESGASSSLPLLRYLTVQDVLWINLQVTKKVTRFDYARLEEAVFYQYGYGQSTGLVPQAARFLSGFPRLRPFEAGNEATAFVGAAAFLAINGRRLRPGADIPAMVDRARQDPSGFASVLEESVEPDPDFHPSITPDVRRAVARALEAFGPAVEALVERERAAASAV